MISYILFAIGILLLPYLISAGKSFGTLFLYVVKFILTYGVTLALVYFALKGNQ